MKLSEAPYTAVNNLYKCLCKEDICYGDEYESWVDIDEYWKFRTVVKNEIEKRKQMENSPFVEDFKERYYKFALYESFYVLRITKANKKSGGCCYGDYYYFDDLDGSLYDKSNIDIRYNVEGPLNSLPCNAYYDVDGKLWVNADDDEGGMCSPIEINKEEYDKLTSFNIKDWLEYSKDKSELSKWYCPNY